MLDEGISFISTITEQDDIKTKFLCKLWEAYGNLMCEPLYFRKCEEYLNRSEETYKYSTANLSKVLYHKFLIKKAAYLKKYGFFEESIA